MSAPKVTYTQQCDCDPNTFLKLLGSRLQFLKKKKETEYSKQLTVKVALSFIICENTYLGADCNYRIPNHDIGWRSVVGFTSQTL